MAIVMDIYNYGSSIQILLS